MQDVKALIVVLALTVPLWIISKPLFAPLSAPGDFQRRRNTWLALTVLGLLAPSIWIYSLIAVPLIYVAAKRDSNPLALYVLLFYVVPNASVPLPPIVINELFDISNQRLLVFALIIPALLRAKQLSATTSESVIRRRLDTAGWLLYAYLLLTIVLHLPHETITHSMRKGLLICLDVGLLFSIWSRLGPRHKLFRDVLGAWVVAAMMMSAIAMFETVRGWLLYVPISFRWGDPNIHSYLIRDGLLRAQVTAGHSLSLGVWLANAWILYLFIQRDWGSKFWRIFVALILLGGLAASLARGAWAAALLGTSIFLVLNPRGVLPAIKSMLGFAFVGGLFLLSPFGERFLRMIPFIGTVDAENVDYRQRLLEVSLDLIAKNPWFGDPFVLRHMESLRQGQGIIDLVNGYLTIALFYGLIALALFMGFILLSLRLAYSGWSGFKKSTHYDLASLGAALIAATVGTMFFIATAGVHPAIYVLAGLLCGYKRMSLATSRETPIPTTGVLRHESRINARFEG